LVDARGLPLSIVVSGANTHDVKLLESTLEAIVAERIVDQFEIVDIDEEQRQAGIFLAPVFDCRPQSIMK
jgi:hypothetical protein